MNYDDIEITLNCLVGESIITLAELKELGEGSLLVSNRKVDKPQIITVNGKPKFEGEVVIVDGEYYGYKITGVIE